MKLLYVGNALAVHGATPTSADILPGLFVEAGYEVIVTSSRCNRLLRLLDMLLSVVRCRHHVEFVLIDTYSTRNFWYAYLCARLCHLLRLRYIPILRGGSIPQRMRISPGMSRSLLQNAFINVAPSAYLHEEMLQFGYPVCLIPNTIPVSKYPFKKRPVLRPRLLYVRAFAELYNPQMALYVLQNLLRNFPDAELCMVGPDKDGALQICKNLAADLDIAEHVTFTGKLCKQDWHKLAIKYDIFINTTHKDNTPVSVMEAMALGLPVVSTNPGGVNKLIDDGIDGLLVDCGDVAAMVAKILFLLDDPANALSIAQKARLKVEKFDWRLVKELWNTLFEDHPI